MTFTTAFSITKPVITIWVITAVLTVLSIIATRHMKDVPGPVQNVAEAALEWLENFFGGVLGYGNMRRYFPIFATFFIFIIVSNYTGLLPTAGEAFVIPTSVLSVTVALAIISFFTTHSIGIGRRGVGGYAKSFLKPFAFLLPLTLLDQVVRPFSLALRLYGNMDAPDQVVQIFAAAEGYLDDVDIKDTARFEEELTAYAAKNFPEISEEIMPGKYVKLEDTLSSFEAILGGECDDIPEQDFLLCGTIDEVRKKHQQA